MRWETPTVAISARTSAEPSAAKALPRFLTTAELAQILRRPESTLRYWRRSGIGPTGIRTGGTFLYPETNVLEWLHSIDTDEALA